MALDYSKLSDDELDAISNDDYSRLSDATLRAITRDPGAQSSPTTPSMDFTPQAVRAGIEAVPALVGGAQQISGINPIKAATANVRDVGNMASILSKNVTPEIMNEYMKAPVKNTAKLAGAYVAGHPYTQAVGQGLSKTAGVMGNVGRSLVQGAVAPESLFLLPYQMAAYEQEKIRQNPNAPGLERNPYAMTYRGEAPTVGAAGAMNQRRALTSMPITGVNAEERRMLEEDQRNRLEMLTRYEAAKRIIGPRQ